ncbi:Multidrug resistance protein 3 [Aquicella lusitana]|uniref:EmrB/QacA subfamily drug resistance transporter n=2 Tax=Aquicella lusitana TaxID=254246 RepID=A0A370GZU0_9COXI|nr:EmrB/QacA subfamily drug resistance transporter [Aquicella lusitana]VVC73219.1 Multidrug resistance protein 3 [Aquicella lusitana]
MWIDFTAVNVALAPIANDLNTNLGTLQWVITAYTLCSASLMAIGGRLGDMYGHRRLFIIGTLIFVISSALAGLASTALLLIMSRVGQGIGIAMVVPITTALVYLIFDQRQKGLALGFLTGTTGVSMAIGPTVGGLLISSLNWRWVFFINIPIGLFAILMALILVPETTEKKSVRIDFPGIITLSAGLFCLLMTLNKIPQWGIVSVEFWGLFLLTLILLSIFIIIETRSQHPLIHLDLLTHKALIGIISLRTCAQYVFFVFMFFISLYMQNILGFSADKAGFLLLTATILLGIFSPFSGHLMNYFSLRSLIISSCFILALSLIGLIGAAQAHSMVFLIVSLMLFGIAYAIHFPTTNFAVLQIAPPDQSALVTGMLFTMAFAGASAGITLSSALLNTLSKLKLTQLLAASKLTLTPIQANLVHNTASGAQALTSLFDAFPTAVAKQMAFVTQKAFVFGFTWIIVICISLAVSAMFIAAFSLKNIRLSTKKNDNYLPEI